MCQSNKRQKAYIDLHLHLDGSITPRIARRLAQIEGVLLPESDLELEHLLSVTDECEDLNDYLQCFELPKSLLQSSESIEEAVYLLQETLKENDIIYAEIRFAPQFHCEKGLSQEEVIKAALHGLQRSDLPCNLILCCMRGNDNRKANLETVRLAGRYLVKDSGVVAVDLAGAEGLFPTKDFAEEFKLAKNASIPFTIHAGEAAGSESVQQALEFGASRIGHGVRIMNDLDLLNEIKQKNICIEMCPTSNRQTGAVDDMGKYPLKKYLDMGLCVTINTDNMSVSATTIQKEYSYIEEMYGITEEQERILLTNAISAAFTTEEQKEKLRKQI